MMDSCPGSREMHTFRKLPNSSPITNPSSSKRYGVVTFEVYGLSPRIEMGIVWLGGMCQSLAMDTEHILAILREHASELSAEGLVHLRLFGSVARGEASPESDVDLLAEFAPTKCLTLVTVGGLESRLSDLLGARVDLSSAEWMREPVRDRVLREAVLAF